MKLNKLTVENFRGFKGKIHVNFPDSNLAVLVGINGAGKSSILKPIVFILNNFLAQISSNGYSDLIVDALDININAIDSSCLINFEGFLPEYDAPISYGFKITTNSNNYTHIFLPEVRQFAEYAFKKLNKNITSNLPIIRFFSPLRDNNANNNISKIRFAYPQLEAYFGGLNSKYFSQYFTEWFVEQTNIENQLKVDKKNWNISNPQLQTVRDALRIFLENFPYAKFSNIRVGTSALSKKLNKKQTIVIDKNGETLAISQLSDGEKLVFQIIMDIAYRLSIANPSRAPLKEGTGVVMIDELDLHLHPSWQKAIITCLQATFPKIQFIVTTHSPLIISQVQKKDILILHDNTCSPLSQNIHNGYNSYGSDLEDILKIVMGTEELLPSDLANQFNQYFQLIEDNALKEAKALQKELILLTDAQHPDILKGQTLMDLKELGIS